MRAGEVAHVLWLVCVIDYIRLLSLFMLVLFALSDFSVAMVSKNEALTGFGGIWKQKEKPDNHPEKVGIGSSSRAAHCVNLVAAQKSTQV